MFVLNRSSEITASTSDQLPIYFPCKLILTSKILKLSVNANPVMPVFVISKILSTKSTTLPFFPAVSPTDAVGPLLEARREKS